MIITLRAGERFYLNGAVIKVDRKTTIELLNDATFLLENHVIQADDATTPLRQIYFAIQVMLMDPGSAAATMGLAKALLTKALDAFRSPEILDGLGAVAALIERSKCFEALKAIRKLYALEQLEIRPAEPVDRANAA